MKVLEHLERAGGPLISFEIIPPLRGGNVQKLLALTEELPRFKPPFIAITSHAAEVVYEETPHGIMQKVKRKGSWLIRPGHAITVNYLEPIETAGATEADIERITAQTHEATARVVDDWLRAEGDL